MNNTSKFLVGLFAVGSLTMASCKKDDATAPDNATGVVAFSVELSLKQSGTDNETVYKWTNSADTANIVLAQGKAYNATMRVIKGSSSSTSRFYFEPSASSSIAVIDLNKDASGLSVGTTSKWVTEAAGTGIVKIAVEQAADNTKLSSAIQAVFKTTVK